ncbi:MAG: hypothetical protein [Caudoviricetes sp.]|nr:MAG: hypothetical protein [Caudoviricetes sp.]
MEDKKITQDKQLIEDLREARRVIRDAKMRLHSLIDKVDTAHDDGSLPDSLYEKLDTLEVLYDNTRLSNLALNQCIDALQEDLEDQRGDENE